MEPPAATPQRRVTIADAGRQLGLDFRAIKRLIAAGELRVISIPGKVRATITQESVDGLLARMNAPTDHLG